MVAPGSAATRAPSSRESHLGVTCDKSGMSPIVGPRYHLPDADYDLCEEEYFKLPEAERVNYLKIERPGAPATAVSEEQGSNMNRDRNGPTPPSSPDGDSATSLGVPIDEAELRARAAQGEVDDGA